MMKSSILSVVLLLCAAGGFVSAQRKPVAPKPTTTNTAAVRKAILRQLVTDGELTKRCGTGANDPIISLAPVDLNRDGKAEYLVRLEDAAQNRCLGERKATIWCYRQGRSGGYERLLAVDATNYTVDEFVARTTKHRGYADLGLSMTQGGNVESVTFAFDGDKYQETNRQIVRIP